jgi:hypothetical protein
MYLAIATYFIVWHTSLCVYHTPGSLLRTGDTWLKKTQSWLIFLCAWETNSVLRLEFFQWKIEITLCMSKLLQRSITFQKAQYYKISCFIQSVYSIWSSVEWGKIDCWKNSGQWLQFLFFILFFENRFVSWILFLTYFYCYYIILLYWGYIVTFTKVLTIS